MSDYAIALAIINSTLLVIMLYQSTIHRSERKAWHDEREEWSEERKDLLDRIQAPTFTEYTNKVIREKKAEKPEEPKEPVDFIS